MDIQIASNVFPPMRSEITKLNKSAHLQSRILSPFVFMTMFLQIVAMDHFVQIIVPKKFLCKLSSQTTIFGKLSF